MSLFRAVILGIVQAATEFLPVSSSGHLIIFSHLLGWGAGSLLFDVMLHLGTGFALVVYFWKDLLEAFRDWKGLGLRIFVAILPAGLVGFLFEGWFESTFRSMGSVVVFLLLGSLLMLFAEFYYRKRISQAAPADRQNSQELSLSGAFFVGLFQMLALFSGFSRSGSTISGGLFFGLNRDEAARFSFLLSVPLVLGAGGYQLLRLLSGTGGLETAAFFWPEALVGVFVSFVVGLLSIWFLMKFLRSNSLLPFVVYRVGLVILLLLAL